MRKRLVIYSIYFVLFVQLISAWGAEPNESVHLVILHVNDTHGLLMPYDTEEAKDIGGIARMATRIKEIREANEGRTLVFHAGDVFSRGDLLTVYYGGEVNMVAMEAAGYDAFTPGNGDFYFGVENLLQQTALVKLPTLLANVFYKENGKRIFQPYIMRELAGVKTAILGLGFIRESHPSGWPLELRDPVAVANEFLPQLRDQADLVIALTHIGLMEDRRLVSATPQVDIIVGGHSHNQIDIPLRVPKTGEEGEVVIAQAGDYGRFLGRLDVYMQPDESDGYHIQSVEGKLLPIDSSIKEDKEIVSLLERYSEPLSQVVCISKVTLANPDEGENPIGNFVGKALRVATGADVALLNRGDVGSGITPGEVTIADICRIHPWRNRVLELVLTGGQIKQVLAEQDFISSGLSYVKVDGDIQDLKIGTSPVELSKAYKVAVGEFVMSAAPSLRHVPFTDTGERIDTVLLKYLKQIAVIEEAKVTD